MSTQDAPVSLRQSTISLLGVDLVCHHLSNGQRVFEADSLETFFEKMMDPTFNLPDGFEASPEFADLVKFIHGGRS